MTDLYNLTAKDVLDWFKDYASFEELEDTAKAVYSIYVQERKQKFPEKHKANRLAKKKPIKKRYPKGYRKHQPALVQNKTVPYTEIRK